MDTQGNKTWYNAFRIKPNSGKPLSFPVEIETDEELRVSIKGDFMNTQVLSEKNRSAFFLLDESVTKLISLRKSPKWSLQLPSRFPPIMWFGNVESIKPKIVTIGANPSRKEYIKDTSSVAVAKSDQHGNAELFDYLESPHNRFRLLKTSERLEDILVSPTLKAEVIAGYNRYFEKNPYTIWFGPNMEPSYKVEEFVHGMGASFYSRNSYPFQAIHIDLIPFATLLDFKKLIGSVEADLFRTKWAQKVVSALIAFTNPRMLVIFGKTNLDYFKSFFDTSLELAESRIGKSKYYIGKSPLFGREVAALSINLGNPVGCTASQLRGLGQRVKADMGL